VQAKQRFITAKNKNLTLLFSGSLVSSIFDYILTCLSHKTKRQPFNSFFLLMFMQSMTILFLENTILVPKFTLTVINYENSRLSHIYDQRASDKWRGRLNIYIFQRRSTSLWKVNSSRILNIQTTNQSHFYNREIPIMHTQNFQVRAPAILDTCSNKKKCILFISAMVALSENFLKANTHMHNTLVTFNNAAINWC
jgi:hypothetical protein